MIGYKLFRKRPDGSYGPLFINKKLRLTTGVTYQAESHPTKGYAYRPWWHICSRPEAPHLSTRGRVWCKVEFDLHEVMHRPANQGGTWFLGKSINILEELT